MTIVNIYEAKTQFSKLIKRARAGQEIIIADAGTPVARLVAIESPKRARVLGQDRGKIVISPGALEPMDAEELAAWEDQPILPEPHPPRRKRVVKRKSRVR